MRREPPRTTERNTVRERPENVVGASGFEPLTPAV